MSNLGQELQHVLESDAAVGLFIDAKNPAVALKENEFLLLGRGAAVRELGAVSGGKRGRRALP